jgi:hypothetical protein
LTTNEPEEDDVEKLEEYHFPLFHKLALEGVKTSWN